MLRGMRLAFWACLAFALLSGLGGAAEPGCPGPRRAVVLGIDGARGDVVQALARETGRVPALKELMERGAYAACPREDAPGCARAHRGPVENRRMRWVTAPGWATVLSGVDSRRHGVGDNSLASLARYRESARRFPSILMRARLAGLETAGGGVGAFLSSIDGEGVYPGVLDAECATGVVDGRGVATATASCNLTRRIALESRDVRRDAKLVDALVREIADARASLLMGVLDQVDEAGHRHGFGGARYRDALRAADALVARLVEALERGVEQRCEAWLVIVTSDHGGHRRWFGGGDHGRRAGTDDAIPFILAVLGGPAPRPLVSPVLQADVHPTVARWLGLPAAGALDGKVQGIEPLSASRSGDRPADRGP
jgi:hypothetical protein